MTGDLEIEIRRATHDDYEAVVAMVDDVWTDRGGDYLPEIYHDWLEAETDDHKKTFVAELDGDLAGIVQAVMLSPEEAWFQSMRVDSAYRRMGVSQQLNEACFEWARERGATVGRIMIFSWNAASLSAARTGGFEPVTEFRWAHPAPNSDESGSEGYAAANDPAAAWRYWTDSDAREHLHGLALAPEESWALRELTRDDLEELDDDAVIAITADDGTCAMAYRSRTFDRSTGEDDDEGENDGEEATRTWAEYGVGAWTDVEAARSLFAAIARDAAEQHADEVRVCIPETAATVSDAAAVCGGISDEPDFVLEIDLTTRGGD